MYKVIMIAAISIFTLVAPAAANDWSLQLRWGGGQLFPQSDEWEELYDNDDIPRHTVSLDADLWKGFGPYIGYQGGRTDGKYLDKIDLSFQSYDLVFGGQYRYPLADWVHPGLRLGLLWINSREVIDDDYIQYEMESKTTGFEIAQDWNFYFAPNAKNRFWRGWGVFFEYYYQHRPVEGMGDLEDTSGFGYHMGIQYKFGFSSSPKKRDDGPSAEEIEKKKKELDELIRKRDEVEKKESEEPAEPEVKTDGPEAEDAAEPAPPSPERETD